MVAKTLNSLQTVGFINVSTKIETHLFEHDISTINYVPCIKSIIQEWNASIF